ncbi:hypothetical protein E2C01_025807 [Portunus trituberculatus]|uniref:Uncharacterized protein n=1 Tax=Portunus trituberculatus TaxID=210409 RepID=A0A5B7EH46_PORTR|nr:hypothetical protein [Portunus trituberculatus]
MLTNWGVGKEAPARGYDNSPPVLQSSERTGTGGDSAKLRSRGEGDGWGSAGGAGTEATPGTPVADLLYHLTKPICGECFECLRVFSGFRLVSISCALLIPLRRRFRNRFRGLMITIVSKPPARLVFIKQRAGSSEILIFGIHQPHSTDSTRNRFRRFRPPMEPVP